MGVQLCRSVIGRRLATSGRQTVDLWGAGAAEPYARRKVGGTHSQADGRLMRWHCLVYLPLAAPQKSLLIFTPALLVVAFFIKKIFCTQFMYHFVPNFHFYHQSRWCGPVYLKVSGCSANLVSCYAARTSFWCLWWCVQNEVQKPVMNNLHIITL